MGKFVLQSTLVVVLFSCGVYCNNRYRGHYARFPKPRTTASPPHTTQGPAIYFEVFPSEGPTRFVKGKRGTTSDVKEPKERQLDSLGGHYVFDYRPPRAMYNGEDDATPDDALDEKAKRYLSSLGGMQLHGYKRALSSLGGMQLHGYKRALSSLGGMQLHGYKRALNSLGGMQLYGDKRALSSLGGMQLHGYKRALSSLGGMQLHGYKRGLSSLGGMQLHGYKRGLSSLGGMQLHGYKRSDDEFPEEIDGADTVTDQDASDDESKRAISSLGGMNLYGGYKRALSSLGGSNLYAYKRDEDDGTEDDLEKRRLSSLGGFNVQRFKRSDEQHDSIAEKDETAKTR